MVTSVEKMDSPPAQHPTLAPGKLFIKGQWRDLTVVATMAIGILQVYW